jgi:hypothetical protein
VPRKSRTKAPDESYRRTRFEKGSATKRSPVPGIEINPCIWTKAASQTADPSGKPVDASKRRTQRPFELVTSRSPCADVAESPQGFARPPEPVGTKASMNAPVV